MTQGPVPPRPPSSGDHRPAGHDWLKSKWVSVGALGVIALIFIFENNQSTTIRLLVPEVSVPLWAALLVVFVIGGIVGYVVAGRRRKH